MTENAPPGWYQNPHINIPGHLMYWDGTEWRTDHVRTTSTTPASYPGDGMGIVALVFIFLLWPVGLVLGIIAYNKSSRISRKNTPALIAIWLGALCGVVSFYYLAYL